MKTTELVKPLGQNFLKSDGTPRTAVIFLYEGLTAQDWMGIYATLNFVSSTDLKISFVGKKIGIVRDERGRLPMQVEKTIDEITSTDIFIVPGGGVFDEMKDEKVLKWVKQMYDSSEYTISVCTGALLLAASGATKGKIAGTAWPSRHLLNDLGGKYVATPPFAVDGKFYSAAGATAGIEIGLTLLEKITGNRALSEVAELGAEWNPRMLYGSGNPETAPQSAIDNLMLWSKSDPIFSPVN